MDKYVTGAVIRKLREEQKMTQEELGRKISVSSKAISKWETGQGFPDISLLEVLARALNISVIELLAGADIRNENRASNMKKVKFYVCPVCGNVIQATGEAVVSCCGITLPALVPEYMDEDHRIGVEVVEDEYFVHLAHPMSKEHYISFIAAVSDQEIQFVKLYPEGNAEGRFKIRGVKKIFAYCNRHGMYEKGAGDFASVAEH
ncbi:Transcriptional regulator [Anaerovibrio sp. JC8]|uniref:helix-turn-helix domain-containing protein n=1 Tax=Anaerovibrio sp. JC8 TaxID=1240085 RepID=UPI000A0B5531|nr:helix-turn-helix domain-containing protein [Anaerovibrio sp. JC8]ORT99908.1 Transcriptional regulator [Anaerovibrio sp. JC8]